MCFKVKYLRIAFANRIRINVSIATTLFATTSQGAIEVTVGAIFTPITPSTLLYVQIKRKGLLLSS